MADIFLQKYENYHKTVGIFHKFHLFIEVSDSQGNGEPLGEFVQLFPWTVAFSLMAGTN